VTGWTLTNTGGIHMVLDGVIPAGGYFLLERTDDNTIKDVPADQLYSNALLNPPTPDYLVLRDDVGVIIDTANGKLELGQQGRAVPPITNMQRESPSLQGWG